MKKFFKGLAMLLALTLILGVIPAAAAEGDLALSSKSKILYVDGSKGTKTDGTKCKITYYKSVRKMIEGFDSETMKLKLASANEDVVTTKGWLIKAAGIGKTDVTVTVTDKATGDVLLNDVLAVNVRKNAESVAVTGIADGDEVIVGTEYTVSLPRYIDGVKVDTDVRALTCDSADVVITPDAEKDRVWTVKFTKIGDYTLTASAYQSKIYKGVTASTPIAVKAVFPVMEDVNQIALNKFEIRFNANASCINLADFVPEDVWYKVAETVVPYSILKSVDYDKADNTKLVVETYLPFVAGREYFVDFNGVEKSFVAAGDKLADVERIEITTEKAMYGTYEEIGYKYFNAVGIDITKSVLAENAAYVPTFELVTGSDVAFIAGTAIYFFDPDKAADVKATLLKGYDENNDYAAIEKYATKQIISTDEAADEFLGIVYSVDAYDMNPEIYGWNDNHNYMIGDSIDLLTGNGYPEFLNVYFAYKSAATGNTYYKNFDGEGVTDVQASDENFVMVLNGTKGTYMHSNSCVELTGVNARDNQTIILYKTDSNGNQYAWKSITINVKPMRKLTTVKLATEKNLVNVNTSVYDWLDLYLTANDQYGDPVFKFSFTDGGFKQTDASKAAVGTWTFDTGYDYYDDDLGAFAYWCDADGKMAFNTGKTEGNVIFNVKVKDLHSNTELTTNNASFHVKDAGDVATKYVPVVTKTKLDTNLTQSTDWTESDFYVEGSKDGYYTGDLTNGTDYFYINKTNFASVRQITLGGFTGSCLDGAGVVDNADGTKSGYVYTVTAPVGEDKYTTDTNLTGTNFDELDAIKNVGGLAKKTAKGTYTYTLYKFTVGQKATGYQNLGSAQVVVTDNQTQPTWYMVTDIYTAANHGYPEAVANECLEVYFVDTDSDTKDIYYYGAEFASDDLHDMIHVYPADVVISDNCSTYLRKVAITVHNRNGLGDFEVYATINKLVNGSNK